jgi:uncharacterized protein YndB with AHSA1/START domain
MADPDPRTSVSDEGFRMVRVFDAPRERVWREWTEPEAFADWWGGAETEVPVSSVAMDVRPGGSWRATMFAGPARTEIQWEGEYREVVEPERLVFTVTDTPGNPERDVVTVVLTDLGDGRTEMVLEQRDHMTAPQYQRAMEGWGTFFDRVDERLAGA